MNRLTNFVARFLVLLAAPMAAHASLAQAVPEPDSLALVAIGVVALIIAGVRNRRK